MTCLVRARCADGWSVGEEAALADCRGDAELVVAAKSSDHGFLARSRAGAEVAVVYEAAVAKLLSEQVDGQVLRILDGVWKEKRSQFEIKAWTEVFLVVEGAPGESLPERRLGSVPAFRSKTGLLR